ncbi:lytic transglycosylase domain-containing protein [Planococcaceae bacterium Storch 2/2-2]|nr:lytic transglycosylase domain-containing protein [Planococcaceae bacterium Storch 2/2-2]
MARQRSKQKRTKSRWKIRFILLLTPVVIGLYATLAFLFLTFERPDIVHKSVNALADEWYDRTGRLSVPEEYIPIYQRAAETYDVPWTLLAAVHRIETRFSTMSTLVSPVGAEGHMQFMPCTFVGWGHPSCEGLGEGDIPESEKTDPAVIAQYGGFGVDANGDGIADPFDLEDAIFSAAHYLSSTGAAEGNVKKALYHYNQSDQYVSDVYAYFEAYEQSREEMELARSQ